MRLILVTACNLFSRQYQHPHLRLPISFYFHAFTKLSISTSSCRSLGLTKKLLHKMDSPPAAANNHNNIVDQAAEPKSAKSLEFIEEFLNRWLMLNVYGESWDNVGLLIGSGHQTKQNKMVSAILLCNDLTTAVLDEAIERGVQLIIAYHPPIFSSIKRIGFSWKDLIISKCLAHDISVYSPHTMLDSVPFGINDSIIQMLMNSPRLRTMKSILPNPSSLMPVHEIVFVFKQRDAVKVFEELRKHPDLSFGFNPNDRETGIQFSIFTSNSSPAGRIEEIPTIVNTLLGHVGEETRSSCDSLKLRELPRGAGRIIEFSAAVQLSNIQRKLKTCMEINHLKVADAGNPIFSVAVCAGSGGSLLKDAKSDLVITGELSHHEVLDFVENGRSVILCGHSNSERHYLSTLAQILEIFINCPNIYVSASDTNVIQWV